MGYARRRYLLHLIIENTPETLKYVGSISFCAEKRRRERRTENSTVVISFIHKNQIEKGERPKKRRVPAN